jgi:hypothetical protein
MSEPETIENLDPQLGDLQYPYVTQQCCRAGNRVSGRDVGRIMVGKASDRPSGRPKAGRADFDAFPNNPAEIRPGSRKQYCVT